MPVLNVTVLVLFWEIALIRANCKSVAIWRAASLSLSPGRAEKNPGMAIAIRIAATPIVAIISMSVKPALFRQGFLPSIKFHIGRATCRLIRLIHSVFESQKCAKHEPWMRALAVLETLDVLGSNKDLFSPSALSTR